MDLRTLLAAVLGVGLGLVLVAAPESVIRVHTAGRLPSDRGGEYGDDAGVSLPTRRLVQALGGTMLGFGLYFGWVALG
ncbi:hypothetical protein C2R22_19055 [Salinigranum rubrum]|uniref:Uncharacterized protein n=1 Tax=Salinigranum rubrum TaxID=755307 RepID=A0A2I8VNH0_9EURY|nr:hypothetical protein [Salinigranum rubrum]AUV83482.1 hypothetical protein C2R22_19055 [Salinigranum rubrum]